MAEFSVCDVVIEKSFDPEMVTVITDKSSFYFNRQNIFTGLLLLSSLAACLLAFYMTTPWVWDLQNDAKLYYQNQLFLNQPDVTPFDLAIKPFFRMTGAEVTANEAKPFFMAALNIWGEVARQLTGGHHARFLQNQFHLFGLFNYWVLFLTLGTLAWRMSQSFIVGLLVPVMMLVCPWSIFFLYYTGYVHFSLILLLITFCLLMRGSMRFALTAGFIFCLALLSNAAFIVAGLCMLLTFALVQFLRKRSWIFPAAGFIGVVICFFSIFEVMYLTGTAQKLVRQSTIETPARTLYQYYRRSILRNHFVLRREMTAESIRFSGSLGNRGARFKANAEEYLKKFPNRTPRYPLLFFRMLSHQSWSLTLALVLAIVLLIARLLQGRLGTLMMNGMENKGYVFLIMGICLLLINDVQPGVKLGRVHYIALPWLILGAVLVAKDFIVRNKRTILLSGLFLMVHFSETALGLADEFLAFQGLRTSTQALPHANKSYYVLTNDMHAEVISKNLLVYENLHDIGAFRSTSEVGYMAYRHGNGFLALGPSIETAVVFFRPADKFVPVLNRGMIYQNDSVEVWLESPLSVPFYGLYPFLVFEDEVDLWRYFSNREFNRLDFKTGAGTIKLWPITQRPAQKTSANVTRFIESVRSSSNSFGHETIKLLDSGLSDSSSWCSMPGEPMPISVRITFSQPVQLKRLWLQSIFSDYDMMETAPRDVVIFAKSDKGATVPLGALQYDFKTHAEWLSAELPANDAFFRDYVISFLNNKLSADRVCVQEIRFDGEVPQEGK